MPTPSPDQSERCVAVLEELIATLREVAPRLNADLPFPARMAITGITTGEVQQDTPNGCSTVLTLHAGDAPKSYRIKLVREGERFRLMVSDETDFEEHLMLMTQPGQPLHPHDARVLYDTLATDIAGHFGTDS